MRPLFLEISAFGAYSGRERLDFGELKGRKFFLIHGATGAGKTTILDAICYALYGSATSDLREVKALRSDHAEVSVLTEVIFTFAIADKVYKVRRSPRQERLKKRGGGVTEQQPEAELWELNGETGNLLEAKYENVTRKITDLLGFECSQFRQVVLLPQGEFRKLLVAKSDERQQIMKTLFKTEIYQKIEEHLRKKAKDKITFIKELYDKKQWQLAESQMNTLEELEETVANLRVELDSAEGERKAAQFNYQQAQSARNEANLIAQKFTEFDLAKEAFVKIEGRLPKQQVLHDELRELERAEKLTEAEKIVRRLQADIQQYQRQEQQQVKERQAVAEALKIAEFELTRVNDQAGERQEVDVKLRELQEYTTKSKLLKQAQHDWQEKQKAMKRFLDDKTDIETKLAKLQQDLAELVKQEQSYIAQAARADSDQLAAELAVKTLAKRKQLAELDCVMIKEKAVLESRQQALAKTQAKRKAMQDELQKAQHLFAIGQAGILAKQLQAGEACPVCGSTVHPQLARLLDSLPTEQAIEALQQQLVELDKQQATGQQAVTEAQTQYDTCRQKVDMLTEELGETAHAAIVEVEAKATAANSQADKGRQALQQLSGLQEKIAKFKEAEERGIAKQKTTQEAYQQLASETAALEAVYCEREQALPKEYRHADVLTQRIAGLQAKQGLMKDALEKAQQDWQKQKEKSAGVAAALLGVQENLKQAQLNFAEEKTLFYRRLEAESFADFAAYAKAKQRLGEIEALRTTIAGFEREFAAAQERLNRAKQAIVQLEKPDLTAAQMACDRLEKIQAELIAKTTTLKDTVNKQTASAKQIRKLDAELVKLQTENGVLANLYQVTRGDNPFEMNFQRFVLGSLLERVTEAANVMLKVMSKSRYLLQRTTDVARKGSASGLDLEVFDNNTGIARGVATLSGGETFLASLALALGLADVVQQYAGGIRLDTIFVDEGFGTLDPESLDMALNTLIELQNGGRLVGIISHVPELKERIDARLEVTIGKRGSHANFHVG